MIPCCRIGTLMASTAESWGGEHAETAIARNCDCKRFSNLFDLPPLTPNYLIVPPSFSLIDADDFFSEEKLLKLRTFSILVINGYIAFPL